MGTPKTRLIEFPLVEGQREDADAKMLPDGYVTRVKNMRLRADARWGVRYDYDALGRSTPDVSALPLTDLFTYDGRLKALGVPFDGDIVPTDIFELVEQDTFEWQGTDAGNGQVRLSSVGALRDIGRPPLQRNSITRLDCAAADGLVCLAYENSADTNTIVHIFNPATDATVLISQISVLHRPRVLAVGSVFFIVGLSLAGNSVEMVSYDPATDTTLQSETRPAAIGAVVDCFDAQVNAAGDGFWLAVHRSTPTTEIIPVDAAGAAGTAVTGPTTAFDHVAVCESSARLHLIGVATATSIGSLYSYTAGALSAGPTAIWNSDAVVRQPGVFVEVYDGVEYLAAVAEVSATPERNIIRVDHWRASDNVLFFITPWQDGSLGTKPAPIAGQSAAVAFGLVASDGPGLTNWLGSGEQTIGAIKDKFAAVKPDASHTPSIAIDSSTGLYYWPNLVDDGDGRAQPVVTEFRCGGSARRQTAEIGGLLYIAGGQIYVHDGRILFEAGFCDTPAIISATPSNGAGSLPSSSTLLVAATYEWRDSKGNFHTSRPSLATTVTMGASDDTVTVVVSGAHSLRRNSSSDLTGGGITVVVWRSVAGINQLRRAATAQLASFGDATSFTLTDPDSTVRENAVIYTQAGRGILSAIEPHEAPLPAEYIWRFGDRLLTAGGPNRYQAQVSKRLFPGEPVTWSGATGFFIRGPETAINGVAAIGSRGILCTAEKLYHFAGDGPDDDGANGYRDAVEIDGSIGLMGWRSLVSTPLGLMFQGSDGQLWVLPIDGGPPQSFRQVQDTMVAYPTVVAAVLSTDEQLVSFFCSNSGGTDSRIVSFDLQAKTWIVDEFATATPITAATSYEGRIVYLSAGIAYQERSTHPPASFIEHGVTSGDIKLGGGAGQWEHVSSQFIGEIRGDCDLRLRVSYDSGVTWTTLTKVHELRTATQAAGGLVRRSWAPLRRKVERVRLEMLAQTAGSATEGCVFNSHAVEYVPTSGAARLPSTKRG